MTGIARASKANEATAQVRSIKVLPLGLTSYTETWTLQRGIHQELIAGTGQETLILCEHNPVITIGRSAREDSIIAPLELIRRRGVEVLHIERGGDVTYHGPGQLVAYPLLDLKPRKQDVGWYMRTLEEVIIRTLARIGIQGFRIDGRTGVWTSSARVSDNPPAAQEYRKNSNADAVSKIAAIGVRLSRWCTLHGLALNVLNQTAGFGLIHPCGMRDITVTSLEQLGCHCDVHSVQKILEEEFLGLF